MSKFINVELKSDSDSELDSDLDSNLKIGSKFDAELMAKLESGSESEEVILLLINFTHTFLLTLNKFCLCLYF